MNGGGMDDAHRRMREQLGAYVLGALEPGERREVERHLDGCTACRDELARLSPLPNLLDRLDADEAAGGVLAAPPPLDDTLLRAALDRNRRTRRELWAWRGVAAAAAALALFLWAPWEEDTVDEGALVAAARPVAAEGVEGTAAMFAWEWGTTVRLELEDLPRRDTYVLWTVGDDGRRQFAGTWGPTESGRARVVGASAIQRDRLERVEVTDEDGEVLLEFDL